MLKKFSIIILLILSRGLLLTHLDYQKSNIIIAAICIVFLFFKSEYLRKNGGVFRFEILVFIILIIVEMCFSRIKYHQSVNYCIKAGFYYFAILLYYIITYKDKCNENIKYIKKWIINFSFVLSIILIVQYFIYNKFRITFIGIDLSRAYRMGGVRIGEGAYFISIGIILTLSTILNRNKNYSNKQFIYYVISFCLELFYIIFVSKTRAFLLVLGISMAMIIFSCSGNLKMKMQVSVISLISVVVILNSNVFKNYMDLSESESYSTNIRLEAINYYIDQVKENKILGTGLIYEKDNHDSLSYILHGEEGQYFKSDVGIIGMYNTFGICGLFWYIYIVLKFIKIIYKKKKRRVLSNNLESVGLLTYTIGTSPTLILLSPDLIVYIVLVMVFIENDNEEKGFSEGEVFSK